MPDAMVDGERWIVGDVRVVRECYRGDDRGGRWGSYELTIDVGPDDPRVAPTPMRARVDLDEIYDDCLQVSDWMVRWSVKPAVESDALLAACREAVRAAAERILYADLLADLCRRRAEA